MGPIDKREPGQRSGFTPEEYSEIFREWGIKRVIRLNEAKYDRKKFLALGIAHDDLFFVDGSNPPEEVVEDFLSVCDRHFSQANPGAIAIHCKAGLGRTGTLIGLYAMKYFKIPAEVFIGWIRIARPGSVLGPQQYFLIQKEAQLLGLSKAASHLHHTPNKHASPSKIVEMSPLDRLKSVKGEAHQGNYLVSAKERHSEKKSQASLVRKSTSSHGTRYVAAVAGG